MVNCHFHGSIDIPTKCHPGWRHTPALFEESPCLLAQRKTPSGFARSGGTRLVGKSKSSI